MSRTPIELMIDRACSILDGPPPRLKIDRITLRCPICGTEKQVEREWFDPPTATVQVFPCLACRKPDAQVVWLDTDGRKVT
jgi:hypothetical protein